MMNDGGQKDYAEFTVDPSDDILDIDEYTEEQKIAYFESRSAAETDDTSTTSQ